MSQYLNVSNAMAYMSMAGIVSASEGNPTRVVLKHGHFRQLREELAERQRAVFHHEGDSDAIVLDGVVFEEEVTR